MFGILYTFVESSFSNSRNLRDSLSLSSSLNVSSTNVTETWTATRSLKYKKKSDIFVSFQFGDRTMLPNRISKKTVKFTSSNSKVCNFSCFPKGVPCHTCVQTTIINTNITYYKRIVLLLLCDTYSLCTII